MKMDSETKIYLILVGLIILIVLFELLGFGAVIIISNSMSHKLYDKNIFLDFWVDKGYNKSMIDSFPLSNGFSGGDLLFFRRTKNLDVGDVGVYYYTCMGCENNPMKSRDCRLCTKKIVHRVSWKNSTDYFFIADNQGQNNQVKEEIVISNEERIPKSLVIGKILFQIPKIGLLKSLLNCGFNNIKGNNCSLKACFNYGYCK